MTTKEFGVCAATVMASKGMRAYMKWYMKNVWKCKAIVIAMVIAAVLTIAIMAMIKVEVHGETLNEQYIVEDKINEQYIVEDKINEQYIVEDVIEESYDRDLTTTVGNRVIVSGDWFGGEVVSYSIQKDAKNVWLTLGESKIFREGWKKNFQVTEDRWVDPNGRLSSWEAIEAEAYNRRVNNYFGNWSINDTMLKVPEELDEKNDLFMIDTNTMHVGIVRLINGDSVEWIEYDRDGNLITKTIDKDEYHYNEMKQNWFE